MIKYSQLLMNINFKSTASAYSYILFYKFNQPVSNELNYIFNLLLNNKVKYHYLSNLKFFMGQKKIVMNGSYLIIFLNEFKTFDWLSNVPLVSICWKGFFINNIYYNKLSDISKFYYNNFYIIFSFLIYFFVLYYNILFHIKYCLIIQVSSLKSKFPKTSDA